MASQFLQQVRDHMRARQYSKHAEESYVYWLGQYIRFHHPHHPRDLGDDDIAEFLDHLARSRKVSSDTQASALNALVFTYRHVLGRERVNVPAFTRAD